MRKLLLGSLALVALASGKVCAADFTPPYKAPPPPAIYDWTGFYVGGHVGWEGASTKGFTDNSCPQGVGNCFTGVTLNNISDISPTSQTMHGWLGGAQFGYNHQFRRLVLGFEVSGSWASVRDQNTGTFVTRVTGGSVQQPLGCSQFVTFND